MRLLYWAPSIAASFLCAAIGSARADGDTTPLAAAGDWLAAAHSPSAVDSPDVCMAMQVVANFFLRTDDSGDIDVRLANPSWSLPSNITGQITVAVNGHTYNYPISSNTASMVDASITSDQLEALVKDMEIAGAMEVTAGHAAPLSVSLDGSNVALTAFMTCSQMPNPTNNTGGTNPFANAPSQ